MFSSALALRPDEFWPDGQWITTGGRLRWGWTNMPRLPPEAINTTFFLFANADDAKAGDGYGGTGFLIARPLEENPARCSVYAVTNMHVAAHGFPVIRMNKKEGGTHIVDLIAEDWVFDVLGYDIAITPMFKSRMEVDQVAVNFIMTTWFASDEAVAKREIGPGEDVCMIGRFLNAEGVEINRPAARFGNISLMPIPMKQSVNDMTLPSYCIDMHSRDGFSGSPVFVFRKPGWDLAKSKIDMADQFFLLLGIHWRQFPERWEIKRKPSKKEQRSNRKAISEAAPTAFLAEDHAIEGLSGMTCVAPASAILALLEHPKLRFFHDQLNERARQQKIEIDESTPKSELVIPPGIGVGE